MRPRLLKMKLDLSKIKNVFFKHNVELAYLFGSQARKKTTPLSDVDFAVLFNVQVPPQEYGDLQARIISELMLILKRSDIDVVALNNTTPLMKFLVINQGEIVFCSNNQARVKFEVEARREYFETEPIRRIQNEAFKKRYSTG